MGPLPRYLGVVLLFVVAGARTPTADTTQTWLDRLNFYRTTAALPPVSEEPSLSGPVSLHARYMVMHDVIAHSENRRRLWATPEGAAAGAVSNLAASLSVTEPETWAVDTWMQAPFHALGILDPALTHVGFGIHRAQGGRIQTAAGLDIIHGRVAATPSSITYPVVWPSDVTTVPIFQGIQEYPNPLASCRGYTVPTGLPLIVQIGSGESVPSVTSSSIFQGERALEHCVFDESTYRNGNKVQQRLGRRILSARDAIVLIPRKPLQPGSRYHVAIDVNAKHIEWTFSISPSSSATETYE